MNGNIKNYLNGIAPSLPPNIVSAETYQKLDSMVALFMDFAASEYIMETHLNTESAEVDFSFRILAEEKECLINGFKNYSFSSLVNEDTWMKLIDFVEFWPQDIGDIWFEMDYGEYGKDIPQPCFFFNASKVKTADNAVDELLFDALKRLLDYEEVELLRKNLDIVIEHLPSDVGLFQVGIMLARNRDRVRIFTAELSREQIAEYLSAIGWWGSFSQLDELFQVVHLYSDGQYILDFDVSQNGISEKIGINFGLDEKSSMLPFLDNLVQHRLCTDAKKRGVLSWPGSRGSFLGQDYGYAALIKDISHFKIGCSPEEGLKAKAYLRIAGVYLKELFKTRTPTGNQSTIQGGRDEAAGI